MSLVSPELQRALAPLFETGSEAEQALLRRMEQEPLLLFDAVTQDLLGQFPHINEAFPVSDDEISATLRHLSGQQVERQPLEQEGPKATPQASFTDDIGGGDV